jgi:hypothetical protein
MKLQGNFKIPGKEIFRLYVAFVIGQYGIHFMRLFANL